MGMVCMNEYNWPLVVFVFSCLGYMSLGTSLNCEFVNMYNVATCVVYMEGPYEQLMGEGNRCKHCGCVQ